ncbi:MAG: hypothetical protein IKJ00_08630 [Clostridia bacterium]|nr:hypothetical protein [Clostridia bacterium]
MKTKLFKRILSMALALVFMLALAAPLAVSADSGIPANADIGIKTAINQNNSATPFKASRTELTQDGLLLHTFVQGGSALMLTPSYYDLTAITEDVTVSIEMTSTHYNWASNTEDAATTVAPATGNRTWIAFGVGTDNSANVNGAGNWNYCTEMTDENMYNIRVCYDDTNKYHLAWNNTVIAADSVIAETIINGTGAVIYDFTFDAETKTMTTLTLTLASDTTKTVECDLTDTAIGAGYFAFGLREVYTSYYTNFDGYVSDIAVKTATETKYAVDFEQKYIDLGGVVTPDESETPDEPLVITPVLFDANRTIPKASATLGFEDTPLTEYVDGAVLHHVDFTKVTDLASVGYYVTKPTEGITNDAKYAYTEQGLYLEGTEGKVYLVPSGIVIPEYNRHFTIEIEFKFVEANNKRYLCLCPNTTLDEATGLATHSGDVCIRYDQTNESSNGFDSARRKDGYTAAQGAAINDARDNFEFVTYQFHFVNRKLDSATITSGENMIEVTPQSALLATDFAFMLGTNSGGPNVKVLIDHVTVIAGEAEDAKETLIWPGEAGANVLITPTSVVKGADTTPDNNNNNTNDKTDDKKADETTDTKATETTAEATESVAEDKAGCGGSIGFAAASVVAIAAGAVATAKRKKED